jgi:hypothetical protein
MAFKSAQSGNPAGRAVGRRNKKTAVRRPNGGNGIGHAGNEIADDDLSPGQRVSLQIVADSEFRPPSTEFPRRSKARSGASKYQRKYKRGGGRQCGRVRRAGIGSIGIVQEKRPRQDGAAQRERRVRRK